MKQNDNKNKKHIKIKNKKDKSLRKKLKHEPGLKKTGDFTMSKGHRYPLVLCKFVEARGLSPRVGASSK